MSHKRLAPSLPPRGLKGLLAACALAALCLAHASAAQSGRRTANKVSPAPAPEPSAEAPSDNPSTRIAAVVVGGRDIDPETKETFSNTVSRAVKACAARLKEGRGPALEVRNGGKMTRAEAVELAKREAGARDRDRPPDAFRQLEAGAREIADRVRNKL